MAVDDNALVVRKRTFYGVECWWIGRGSGKRFTLYGDIYAPTGYGFRSKAKAEKIAAEIDERLHNNTKH